MVLALRYGDLSAAISESNKLANELGQYCDELSRKVQQKMYAVEGGMSSALGSADYYVNQKISQLRTREANARTLASKSQTLLETAKRVDADVERTIQANQTTFFEKNPELKPSDFQQAWTSFMCDMKNVPVIGWLIGKGEEVAGEIDQLDKEIRHWYKCGGGEQLLTNLVDISVKTVEACAAVAAVGLAASLGLPAMIGFGILAGIAIVNAMANVGTSIQAIQAGGAHPAMSKIYSERDTLKQVLREENFGKKWNRFSNIGASAITGLEVAANILIIAGGAITLVKKWSSIQRSFNWLTQAKDFKNLKLSLVDGPRSLLNGAKTIGVKLFRNLPQIAKDEFKKSSIIKVLKDWQWVKHPAKLYDTIKDGLKLVPEINKEFKFYQKNKVFYDVSDQLKKLRGLGVPKIKTPISLPPSNICVTPKFEYRYPYLDYAAAM